MLDIQLVPYYLLKGYRRGQTRADTDRGLEIITVMPAPTTLRDLSIDATRALRYMPNGHRRDTASEAFGRLFIGRNRTRTT
jgi:hypothetical protein